jgi:hypothetical protein
MDKKELHFIKVKKILTSCENLEHLKTAVKIINQFNKQYRIGKDDPEYLELDKILYFMKKKCGIRDREERLEEENLSTTGKEFKVQAGLSGEPELQKLKFEQDKIEGGLADNKTPKDIAKKHNVKVDDIRNQIEKGIDVEKEHTNDPDKAEEIAMDHEDEFPYYYDALGDMEKDLEKEEELEESTTAGSSGAFVGKLGGKNIRRTFHKSKVPVAGAGGMTTPIGKIRTFKKSQLKEANVFTKEDILNENIGPIATYDSPAGWGDSEFMGTKGKKGNAVQRKGNDHKKTYDYDTGSSTFVKIKDKCKKFPYCVQDSKAIELSKKPFKEGIKDKIPNKENIKESWNKFVEVAKREGKESIMAAKILKKVLTKEETSEKEIQFLKEQSGDIAKMLGVVAMGVVSTALPIIVEKMLNKKGISILPKKSSSDLTIDEEREKLVESICKKTGKSKNYVHSLINRYL